MKIDKLLVKDDAQSEGLSTFEISPEEMHMIEDWFHGKIDPNVAEQRLLAQIKEGNGVFLVRNSHSFIGDYSLSFLYEEKVYHCRIESCMGNEGKKYFFSKTIQKDTLFELISYYMQHPIGKK